jgi:HlyD family secretion protein
MEDSKKSKKGRYLVIGVIITIIIGGALFMVFRGIGQGNEDTEMETAEAFIGYLSASATAGGDVAPKRSATLSIDSPGRVEAVHVRAGDEVQAGDVLLELETTTLALNVASAEQNLRLKQANLDGLLEGPTEADLAAAEAAVASAQAQLDKLLAGATPEEIAVREADLKAAQANVLSSSGQLSQTANAIKPADIRAAEAALAAAESNLKSVEIQHTRNPDPDDITANTALAEAGQRLNSAQAQLDLLLAGPDQNQLGSAQAGLSASSARRDAAEAQLSKLNADASVAQIAASDAQLAQAKATLDNLLSGATAEQLAVAEAELEQARINLEDVQDALDSATLTAPFDGIVTVVNFSEGEFASGPAIGVIDDSQLEVILEVDEVDIGNLAIGQPATVSLEAWPDVEIESQIALIVPKSKTNLGSNLVVYELHLDLGPVDLPVRVGMTADANLVTAETNNVLLVPNQALDVDRGNGTYSVRLLVGETVEVVPVTIGLRDNRYTQITSGLNPGDEVLTGELAPAGGFGPGGDRPAIFGGDQ